MAITQKSIVDWVNNLFATQFDELLQIPAKYVAVLLNAMYGPSGFSLSKIVFDDSSATAQLQNCIAVIAGVQQLGFQTKLPPMEWARHADFTNTLLLWRWIKQSSDAHPIPSGVSMQALMGGASSSASASNHVAGKVSPAPVALNFSAAPSGVGASNSFFIEPTSKGLDTSLSAQMEPTPNQITLKVPTVPPPQLPVLTALAHNRATQNCSGCGATVKKMAEANEKELNRLLQLHKELQKATHERDIMKVLQLLEQSQGPSTGLPPSTVAA
jgi:hypothetical protein